MKKMNYLIAALLLCSPIAHANDLDKLLGKLPHPPLPSGHLPMPPAPPMPGAVPVPVPVAPRGDDRYRDDRYRDDHYRDDDRRHHDHGHHYGQRKHHRD